MLAPPYPTFPVLATERLRLRELADDDAPALLAMFSDPEVMRYWGRPPFSDIADARELLDRIRRGYREGRGIEWAVTLAGDDRLIGKVCHHRILAEHHRAEMGYGLARAAWRNGYAVEALRAIVDFGFGQMGLHSIEAQLDPDNLASRRTLERLGFVEEGHLRENFRYPDGRFGDTAIYSLLAR